MQNRYPYVPGGRFPGPADSTRQVVTPYDQDSNLFQDLKQRGINPVKVIQNIDLSIAGSLFIDEPGYHFVIYGHDGDAIKTVNTTALVQVYINQQNNSGTPFPAKHARGFSGPFSQLFLTWPAQTAGGTDPVFCDVVIHRGSNQPWIDGESAT